MITKDQVAQRVRDNFADPRILSTQLFVYNLLERSDASSEVPRWRIQASGMDITSLGDFVARITGDAITVNYPYDSERLTNDRVTGVDVVFSGLVLTVSANSNEDRGLFNLMKLPVKHEERWCVRAFLSYMNDGDEVLPMKITNVRLIPAPH